MSFPLTYNKNQFYLFILDLEVDIVCIEIEFMKWFQTSRLMQENSSLLSLTELHPP